MTEARHLMNAVKHLAPLMLAGLLAACASPVPAPVLLTLPSAAGSAAEPDRPVAALPLLVVRRVAIPEYLVARRVRYRADPATLAEWPDTYWAERIEIGVSREFMSALHRQLPGWTLCDASCGDQGSTMSLQVELVKMDFLRSTRMLQARARITLSGVGMPAKVLSMRESAYEIPADADSPQAQAQAITVLLQRLASDTAPLVRDSHP